MGPLEGYRIIEVAGIGPGPFACMMLADMGADIIRLERPTGRPGTLERRPGQRPQPGPAVGRHRPQVPRRRRARPRAGRGGRRTDRGVPARRGRAPRHRARRLPGPQPQLVYGRMTGWGQDGPYAHTAGHDINYIALGGRARPTSAGKGETPAPPINLVGDFGGGGMLLAFGVVCALLEATALRAGPGRRRRHGRRHGHPHGDDVRVAGHGLLGQRAGREHASTAARTSTTPTRPPTASTSPSARSSRSSTPSCSRLPGSTARTCPRRWTAASGPR